VTDQGSDEQEILYIVFVGSKFAPPMR
jgi:hypothetical protein